MHRILHFDVAQMQHDATAKGWNDATLARRAGVHKASVLRFWSGAHRTAGTGAALTRALGRRRGFYLMPAAEGQPAGDGAGIASRG